MMRALLENRSRVHQRTSARRSCEQETSMWVLERSETTTIARPLLARPHFSLRIWYLDRSLAKVIEDCVMQVALHAKAFFHISHYAAQFEFERLFAKAHEK